MIKKQGLSHHDKFFKSVYSDSQLARELFFLAFSQKERQNFDWNQLRSEKDNFPENNKRADLIFSVPLKSQPDKRLRLSLLLEHKSKYEMKLFHQILSYQYFIYDRERMKNKAEKRVAPVIPVLFYHGKEAWRWPLYFQEAVQGKVFFKYSSELRENMLNYKIRLINTHDLRARKTFENKKLQSRGVLKILDRVWDLKLEKRELVDILSSFSHFSNTHDDIIISVIEYLKSLGMSKELWENTEKELVDKSLFKKGDYMDIREEIREEGRKEGRLEGRQEGQQQLILNMLKEKTDISFISKVTGLSKKEIEKLKKE